MNKEQKMEVSKIIDRFENDITFMDKIIFHAVETLFFDEIDDNLEGWCALCSLPEFHVAGRGSADPHYAYFSAYSECFWEGKGDTFYNFIKTIEICTEIMDKTQKEAFDWFHSFEKDIQEKRNKIGGENLTVINTDLVSNTNVEKYNKIADISNKYINGNIVKTVENVEYELDYMKVLENVNKNNYDVICNVLNFINVLIETIRPQIKECIEEKDSLEYDDFEDFFYDILKPIKRKSGDITTDVYTIHKNEDDEIYMGEIEVELNFDDIIYNMLSIIEDLTKIEIRKIKNDLKNNCNIVIK